MKIKFLLSIQILIWSDICWQFIVPVFEYLIKNNKENYIIYNLINLLYAIGFLHLLILPITGGFRKSLSVWQIQSWFLRIKNFFNICRLNNTHAHRIKQAARKFLWTLTSVTSDSSSIKLRDAKEGKRKEQYVGSHFKCKKAYPRSFKGNP